MKIAYLELPHHTYSHVAKVDGTFLAQNGDDIMIRETRLVKRESVLSENGFHYVMADVVPPRLEILSESPVARWIEVPEDTPVGVHKPGVFPELRFDEL